LGGVFGKLEQLDGLEGSARDLFAQLRRHDIAQWRGRVVPQPGTIPKPGITYPEDTDAEWVSTGWKEASDKVRDLLKASK